MNFARKNLYCKHCWDNSFKYYSPPKSKKNKSKAKLNSKSNSNSDSSTQPKVYRAKACRLWVIDSGCSRHMTGFKHLLHNYVEEPVRAVRFANSEVEGHVRGYGMLDNGVVKIQKVL
ncbi:hypothetical protein L6452_27974 [Arctium lappa]|uniref:Uncharacterized protein n=1 Tax=Arctium lappa TaxID=4217 RepID=A0ACB8ZX20_ARCLA|nr:hypothetical protein L6452_27974 [Arctium lappa]